MSSILSRAVAAIGAGLVHLGGGETAIANIEDIAVSDLALVMNGEADYLAGKPVVLGTLSEGGKTGKIVAIVDGCPFSVALGLGSAA